MSLLNIPTPQGLAAKLATAVLGAVVVAAAAGYAGYKYGSSVTYKSEHEATEACTKELTDLKAAALQRNLAGQGSIAAGVSENEGKKSDSEKKRQDILNTSPTTPAKPVVCPVVKATATNTNTCTCPATVTVPVMPRTFSHTINSLLEASHETGFYRPR